MTELRRDGENLREHRYLVEVRWIGNNGTGTSGYREYKRNHIIDAVGKPSILGSADPKSLAIDRDGIPKTSW
jgi:hypothetical protein